jgi:hypothetical protein
MILLDSGSERQLLDFRVSLGGQLEGEDATLKSPVFQEPGARLPPARNSWYLRASDIYRQLLCCASLSVCRKAACVALLTAQSKRKPGVSNLE